MKTYTCDNCGNLLYFENDLCLQCYHAVGFSHDKLSIVTLEDRNGWLIDISDQHKSYRYCKNKQHNACNWLIPTDQPDELCLACSFNGTIPSLDNQDNIDNWKRLEIAKHRLIYSLLRLELPLERKKEKKEIGLQFDFLNTIIPEEKVTTGHDNGVITINAAEADEVERVSNKINLREKYRTLLGHFRHEVGHYYWDILIKDSELHQKFRNLFGDETLDYTQALQRYYEWGAPTDWTSNFISPYATAHPWEDWAESWSHYMHMMDTLETAHTFGIAIRPSQKEQKKIIDTEISKDPYTCKNFQEIIDMWFPLTFAVNSLNRSMGYADFYPFIISPPVIEKLRFIHDVCRKFSKEKVKVIPSSSYLP